MAAIIHRDTITGQIVTAAHAKANPGTTTREVRRASELRRELTKAEAKIAELEELVEVEYAGRMRLAEQVRAVRRASASHPEVCDRHDDGPITCGWKHAVVDMRAALDPAILDGHEGGCEPDLEPEPACLIHDTSGEDVRGWEMAECTCPMRDGHDDDHAANSNSKAQLGVGLEPIVRTVGDLTARHQLSRPQIRVAGREGTLKVVKPSDMHPGTLTLIWGDWWEDVSLEEPCEVLS